MVSVFQSHCFGCRFMERFPDRSISEELLVVNGSDGLAFVRGGQEDVNQAMFCFRVYFFAFEEVVDLVIGQAECVFVGFGGSQ